MATYPRALTQSKTRPIFTDDVRFTDNAGLLMNASWIWTNDTGNPVSSITEQRAFRITYPYPVFQNGTPIQPDLVTIFAAADDYFAMYVNGALVHSADPRHNSSKLVGFDVPLPIVSGSEGTEFQGKGLTLGFRVVNRDGFAGLLVGAVVQWKDGFVGKTEEPTFYTGGPQDPNVVGTWFGERLLEEGWEQPDGLRRSEDVKWDPAMVYSERFRPKKEGRWSDDILDNSIKVFDRLELPSITASSPGGPASTSTSSESQCQSVNQVKLSSGQFAGLLVGSLIAIAILASLLTWLVTRRKLSRTKGH